MSNPSPTPSRYQWTFKGISFDFYRLCEILGITHHAQAHALKKVIRAGRSVKPVVQDIDEAIDSLRRWREMVVEDTAVVATSPDGVILKWPDNYVKPQEYKATALDELVAANKESVASMFTVPVNDTGEGITMDQIRNALKPSAYDYAKEGVGFLKAVAIRDEAVKSAKPKPKTK